MYLESSSNFYGCNCSRQTIINRYGNSRYEGFCRNRNLSIIKDLTNVRLKVNNPEFSWNQKNYSLDTMGDFVVWRKDDLPAYQLFSLIDDINTGVNFIVRGEDLIQSSGAQTLLAQSLSLFFEPEFCHHSLVQENGEKLSKSKSAEGIRTLGLSKEQVFAYAANFLGLHKKIENLEQLIVEIPQITKALQMGHVRLAPLDEV